MVTQMYAPAAAPSARRALLRETGAEYRPSGKPGGIPERLLAQLWQKRAARPAALYDNHGRRVQVLYPGRPGGGPGPDFRDAILEMEGLGLVRGDLEIHRRQGDWDAHGHRRDPGYNGVVLHAALEVSEQLTLLAGGQPVPVMSLAPLLADATSPDSQSLEAAGESGGVPGAGAYLWQRLAEQGYPQPEGAGPLATLLDRAGDARFKAKSALFQRFLREQSPDQTLYEGLMEALGYHKNQQAFLNLASRAPYAALRNTARRLAPEQRAGALHGWLLRLSGLGTPAEGGPGLPRGPGFGAPLTAANWHTVGVRPANHPRRRIAGAAELLARYLEPGLAADLGEVVRAASPKALEQALVVCGANISINEAGEAGGAGLALVGGGWARDMAVNVVLPFLHGMAQRGEAPLDANAPGGQECADLYARMGKLQENDLTREMAGQLLAPWWSDWHGVVTTARRQQGLLHLHHLLKGGG